MSTAPKELRATGLRKAFRGREVVKGLDLHVKAGEIWFGSPAIKLPNRQKVVLSGNWTYEPPRRMRLWRTCFEAMHTSFPTAVLITTGKKPIKAPISMLGRMP